MNDLPTVLVVDDDAAVRESLSRSLRKRGYAVEAFDSAQTFLDATGDNRLGCLVLDVCMPEISGMVNVRVLRKPMDPNQFIDLIGQWSLPGGW